MHGIIHLQLQKFVEGQHSPDVWRELCRRAGLERTIYTAIESYPDEQLVQLVTQAVALTGVGADQLLERFGQFLVPTYLSVYGALVRADWRTLDLLEHTENTIHRVVRKRQAGAQPPELKVSRISQSEVLITYASPRRLCAVARGIVQGVAAHYGESVSISEATCMQRGSEACRISVRLQS
jgi:Haem-NO-binding